MGSRIIGFDNSNKEFVKQYENMDEILNVISLKRSRKPRKKRCLTVKHDKIRRSEENRRAYQNKKSNLLKNDLDVFRNIGMFFVYFDN